MNIQTQTTQPTQCVKQVKLPSSFFSFQLPLSQRQPHSMTRKQSSKRILTTKLKQQIVASLDAVAGLSVMGKTLSCNSRLYCGLVLLLVVAPLTNCFYLLFDSSVGFPLTPEVIAAYKAGLPPDGQWYYVNWHFFFSGMGPHIFVITSLIGVFLLFPVNNLVSYSIAVPLSYEVGKVFWLTTVTTDAEFNQVAPGAFILLALLLVGVCMLSFRFWMDRKFHKYDGICKRIEGLKKLKGLMDESERLALLDNEYSALRSFQTKF